MAFKDLSGCWGAIVDYFHCPWLPINTLSTKPSTRSKQNLQRGVSFEYEQSIKLSHNKLKRKHKLNKICSKNSYHSKFWRNILVEIRKQRMVRMIKKIASRTYQYPNYEVWNISAMCCIRPEKIDEFVYVQSEFSFHFYMSL